MAEALAGRIEEAIAACGALYVMSNTLVGPRERALTLRALLVKLNVEEARLLTELNDPKAAGDAVCALGTGA